MALSKENENYLDDLKRSPIFSKVEIVDILKQVLKDEDVVQVRTLVKAKEIQSLNTQKADIENRITELSK